MDPSQLPTMRAGLGGPTDDEGLSATQRRLIATVTVMTRKAGEAAALWASHAGRAAVEAADVDVGLRHQARHFVDTLNDDAVIAEVLEMERLLFGASDSDSDSAVSDSADESDSDDPTAPAPVPARDHPCACATCAEMRRAAETWDEWVPQDDVEAYLKHSVDAAINSAHAALDRPDGKDT